MSKLMWVTGGKTGEEVGTNADAPCQPLNAITVDVEDWVQSCLDPALPLTDRFRRSTRKVLDSFADRGVRGTFFVLGLAAQKAPELVREIQRSGHEVQSHGYGHRLISTQTPAAFRQDIDRSKKLLEDLCGVAITGYRAPAFSITAKTLWALDELVACGFRYDSSIFPLRTRRYGIDGVPRWPYRIKTPAGGELVEVPVASYRWCGRLWPVGGGGYFRLLPYVAARTGVAQINRSGFPATIYMHPYEFDPSEFQALSHRIPWKRRLHQGLGRRRVQRRIDRWLREFRFSTITAMIESMPSLTRYAYSDSTGPNNEHTVSGLAGVQVSSAHRLPATLV